VAPRRHRLAIDGPAAEPWNLRSARPAAGQRVLRPLSSASAWTRSRTV